ncbi:MAG: insulinase family protein [Elusimicrobia bacterium]|nr:insulinase family protein [Elusimicrobiota bacterium]
MASADEITKLQLDNGMTLIYKKIEPLPIVSVQLFLKLGSVSDPADKLGLTNLMQMLITKGTASKNDEQISKEIEALGGSIGASETEDYCETSLNITKKYFNKAFEIFADIIQNPSFPENELQKEKTNVIAGIKSRQDHIFDVTLDLLRETVYQKHPYANTTFGTEETIKKITRDDIVAWHKKHYGPQNMVMVVTGNIGLGEIKKVVKKYLNSLPAVESVKYDFPAVTQTQKSLIEKKKFEQAYLMYGFLAPEVSNEHFPKIKVLNTYLGGGMSSILFQELREKAGLGYEVSSFYQSKKDKSMLVIYIGLDKASLETAKAKVDMVLSDLKTKPIDVNRFSGAKKYIKGISVLDHQTGARQGWYLGWWEITGKGYQYDKKYLSEIEQVTPADLKNVINKYLTDKFVQIQIIPEK